MTTNSMLQEARGPRTTAIHVSADAADRIRQQAQRAPNPIDDVNATIAVGNKAIVSALDAEDMAALLDFRSNPDAPGAAIITNLPVDRHLGPTPPDGKPSIHKKTFVSEAVVLGAACIFGEPCSYKQEKNGHPVHDITPVREKQHAHSNAGSRHRLDFHTEAAVLRALGPDLLLLLGLRRDHAGVAITYTADIGDAMQHLTAEEVALLRAPNFELKVPESFAENGCNQSVLTPVITGCDEYPEVTVNFDRMEGKTPAAAGALRALGAAFEHPEVLRETRIEPGDLVIINNRKTVHGRSPFDPRWDGADRWLQRVYVKWSLWGARGLAEAQAPRVLSIAKMEVNAV